MTVTNSPEVDPDLAEMIFAFFQDRGEAHRDMHSPVRWNLDVWNALDGLGLTNLTATESRGGSAAGWPEAAVLLEASAWHGVRIPYAEHDLLTGWVRDQAGLPAERARYTIGFVDGGGLARRVPWAAEAEVLTLVYQAGPGVVTICDVATDDADITPGTNRIGEPRDDVAVPLELLRGNETDPSVITQLRLRGSLARTIQVCAALDRALDLTVTYVGERTQFGRPLAKFQAIQHLVSDIAAESALARAATEAALSECVRTEWTGESLEYAIGVARSCAGHAASSVARNAHQVLGAIGTTREHPLHHFTQAALTWRNEYGSLQQWDDTLTRIVTNVGRDGFWSLVTR
ncbi:acyl-CoA dehydrogenase [Gordonia jinghuaiqii]|uniref:Acyl-CoA/acyl-ACP dehydrogenase n=1 Tax=Gordonia jinghuaiqii TaxID=2758710 RepID=A0A7D7R446_9ACTN|nr:acyl-CoA dehydrogenase family protein [Gordonia jinghuaiqii]MCR5978384.1 acyl-CoA dehydrogenase [Gordonia jinghuaiqii]QMT02727.1 acyl-CoA/acyl-ACP dehydrogenase [Gordonia jinghuaiqii]